MTTVAYRDDVLASDSLTSAGGARVGWSNKSGGRGRLLWAGCGDAAWLSRFESWLRSGAGGAPPELKRGDDTAQMAIFPGGDQVIWFVSDSGAVTIRAPFFALGSGRDFALGAMARGARAHEAVAVAIQFDTSSGGPINVRWRRP